MGVPPVLIHLFQNGPRAFRIHELNHPAIGYPHDLGNLKMKSRCPPLAEKSRVKSQWNPHEHPVILLLPSLLWGKTLPIQRIGRMSAALQAWYKVLCRMLRARTSVLRRSFSAGHEPLIHIVTALASPPPAARMLVLRGTSSQEVFFTPGRPMRALCRAFPVRRPPLRGVSWPVGTTGPSSAVSFAIASSASTTSVPSAAISYIIARWGEACCSGPSREPTTVSSLPYPGSVSPPRSACSALLISFNVLPGVLVCALSGLSIASYRITQARG